MNFFDINASFTYESQSIDIKCFDITAPDTPGSDGEVTSAFIQKFELTTGAKQKYPLVLLKLMKRHAEDLIWANDIEMGEKIFKFILRVTEERDDASAIREGQFYNGLLLCENVLCARKFNTISTSTHVTIDN